ncbi:MAG TPA: hypothetical protein VE222_12705 [Nitrospiraceae bacterium]|nr:hypothetical protein [Nitrospiraceae bacterium]
METRAFRSICDEFARLKLVFLLPCIGLLFVLGCASTASYEGAFSSSQQIQGSSEFIPAPMDTTWAAVLEILSKQGFLVQQVDTKSRIILANRHIQDIKDEDLSYTVTATLTFVPSTDQITQVMLAANQTTELHKKEYRWWKLLWLIPLIPIGTDYTTIVVNRDTVRSPQIYHDFFTAVMKSCDEKKARLSPPAAPPR